MPVASVHFFRGNHSCSARDARQEYARFAEAQTTVRDPWQITG